MPPAASLEIRAEAQSELPRGTKGRVQRPTPSSIPGTHPTPGEASGKQRGLPAPRARLRKAGGARPSPRQRSLEEKREKGNRHEARLGSRGRTSRGRCPAGRPDPSSRRALTPRGSRAIPGLPPGPYPSRREQEANPRPPPPGRRQPRAPLPRSGRAKRREGMAAPAGALAAAAAGTCWAGRLFIAAGSGAARLRGAAPPPPAPPHMPRARSEAGRAGALSAGPAHPRPGSLPPAGSLGPASGERFSWGLALPGRRGAAGEGRAPHPYLRFCCPRCSMEVKTSQS